jgi:hypothetical protein
MAGVRRAVGSRVVGASPVWPATAIAFVALAALAPGSARAQLCHDLPDLESHHAAHGKQAGKRGASTAEAPSAAGSEHEAHGAHAAHGPHGLGFAVGLRVEAATAAIQRRPIDYQGTSLRVDVHWRRFHLRAQGSWYRLRDSLEHTTGPGDVLVAGMWTAYQAARLHAGIALPVGLPTGDADARLGMGHVMIMPGVFAALKVTPAITASAGLAYNRALESGDGHNHGIGPYVNPMTKEELGFAGRVAMRAAPQLSLVGEAAMAVPIDGDPRLLFGGGFAFFRDRFSITALVQAGALTAPFTARGVADFAYAF